MESVIDLTVVMWRMTVLEGNSSCLLGAHPVCHSPRFSYYGPRTEFICYWGCFSYTQTTFPLMLLLIPCRYFHLSNDTPGLKFHLWPKKKKKRGGQKTKNLLLKIIWKFLDKRTSQIPSNSDNQWTHASQPFRSMRMKYKRCVFNFPPSSPLDAFFSFFFESTPARADQASPLKEFVPTCHLQPANSLSSTAHSLRSWLCRTIPILSDRICKDSCWAPQTFGGGENVGLVATFSYSVFTERNSCDVHM